MSVGVRRTVGGAIVALALLAGPALVPSAPTASAAPRAAAPTPSPARPGRPTSVAVVGDSITQATGTGALGAENPKNSWATGWEVNSVAARLGIPTNARYNYAANGDKMVDFAPQITNGKSGGSGSVAPMPSTTGLVLVEFGGNDLCKDSVAQMTAVETYRTQFKAGLAAVTAKAPTALVQVLSVPDIYNLWYIRGAPQHPTYHPEPESSQAGGINGARFYWSQSFFPCRSLLSYPDSWDDTVVANRQAVRARTKAYNAVLAEECAKVLRCRFDDNRLFNLTSNRQTPPDGPLWPQIYWNFTDLDISRNTADLCPIPGLVGGGCGDHFHPSKQGQGKIANVAELASRDWNETTYPTAGGNVLPSTRSDGLHHGRATVRFSGADNAGLRGQEVRVHHPDGSVTGWSPHIGVAPDRVIDKVGTSYVEVRSLDVNGNLSAGTLIPVEIDPPLLPTAPATPTLSASSVGLKVSWGAPADDGGGTISRYDLEGLVGTPPASTGTTPVPGATSAIATPPAGEVVRFNVRAVNSTGAGPPSATSAATIAPFASLASFVDRQYRDFTGRGPTGSELSAEVAKLAAGTESPSAMVDRLRSSTWFDGAYGPAIRLYRAYFLRLPDPSGLDYWANRRREGRTLSKISQQFSVSSEFQRRYGSLTNADFIDQIYNNVFGRDPDPGGRDFYLRRLASGWSRGQVVLQFSESSEYKRLTTPIVTVVELARGMNGRAPSQIDVEYRLLDYANGGSEGVYEHLIGTTDYRTRVFG